jgi:hypothetical protein
MQIGRQPAGATQVGMIVREVIAIQPLIDEAAQRPTGCGRAARQRDRGNGVVDRQLREGGRTALQ